jgi:hypothetical protein
MKQNFIIYALLFAININVYSQDYQYVPIPTSGAIWSEVFQPPLDMWGNWPPPIFERFAFSGEDTLINNLTYKKLYIFYDTAFDVNNATYIGGIREDENKKVFYTGEEVHSFKPSHYDGNEILLYNFALNVGDTLQEANLSTSDTRIIVSNIDSIRIGNTLRKRYSFKYTFGFEVNGVKWIEGIGNIKGLLFTSGSTPTNGLNNYLICFKQNHEILYFNEYFTDCMPSISHIRTPEKETKKVVVFPNPTTNCSVQFDISGCNIENISIFNTNGILLNYQSVVIGTEYVQITHCYPSGIYFYSATNRIGKSYNGKFIIQ